MMRQMQQTTNMLLAAFMKMNPDLLQALPAGTPSPPLMIGSVAFGLLLSRSSTGEAEAIQLPQCEANDSILPTVFCHRIQDDNPMSSVMHPSPAKVRRPKAASVVPESPQI